MKKAELEARLRTLEASHAELERDYIELARNYFALTAVVEAAESRHQEEPEAFACPPSPIESW